MKLLGLSLQEPSALPLTRSGWFYVWIFLVGVVLWGEKQDYWASLEKANLLVWKELLPAEQLQNTRYSTSEKIQTHRIIDVRLDSNGLEQLAQLAVKYPIATFAIIGENKPEFLQLLNQKKFTSLAKASVLLSVDQRNSIGAIDWNSLSISFLDRLSAIDGLAVRKIRDPKWQVFQNLEIVYQPISPNNQTLLWKKADQYYLSFVFRSVLKNKAKNQSDYEILFDSGIIVHSDSSTFPAGLNGKITSLWSSNEAVKVNDFLADESSDFEGVFIIDDLSVNNSSEVSSAISSLANGQYLVSSLLTELVLWLGLIFVILLPVLIERFNNSMKGITIASIIVIFIAIQSAFFYFSQWFSLHLVLMIAVVTTVLHVLFVGESNYLKSDHSRDKKSESISSAVTQDNFDRTVVITSEDDSSTRYPTVNILQLEKFGRYQVNGILGKGAMGIVFQGLDPKINRPVAIKTLQINNQSNTESVSEAKERFFREAETAGKLSHANIVTIYDVGEETHPGTGDLLGYIAMDLLTGNPLSEHSAKSKLLPIPLIYQLMIQITDALEYAHNQNVIHRDIKPANIIYDDELQRATITDFGIAHMADHSKTKTGTIIGSPFYMSPEQVSGIKVDSRSDIFSLGVTFYQLLSGSLPFEGDAIATVALNITKTKHEPVRNENKKLVSSANRITNKALQKDASKRYQSMQEFKQALVNALKRDYRKAPLQ